MRIIAVLVKLIFGIPGSVKRGLKLSVTVTDSDVTSWSVVEQVPVVQLIVLIVPALSHSQTYVWAVVEVSPHELLPV